MIGAEEAGCRHVAALSTALGNFGCNALISAIKEMHADGCFCTLAPADRQKEQNILNNNLLGSRHSCVRLGFDAHCCCFSS